MHEGRRISVSGIVQGVGFRPWVYRLAMDHGLGGWVRNDASGVTLEVFGEAARIEAFLRDMARKPPPAAVVGTLRSDPIPFRRCDSFSIVASDRTDARQVSIPSDLATCRDCLAELRDPADRRFRYAFTNCTNCGPRFTITRDVPYDRPATTMAAFRMCAACQREYDDPADRRFHAQPNACPACGPRLELARADGTAVPSTDPLAAAAALLREGRVVAVKGLGGFHLACDATSEAAVAALRARKRRDEKPFAVMTADLAGAEALAVLDDAARALLAGIERPIVLVPARPGNGLADNIAPRNTLVGVMLPYTPLHHLLLDDVDRPLVMTSGNLSEEPLAATNDEAIARLRGIADAFLLHDRDIATRCDDSVARIIAGRPLVFRRSRGFVPRGIAVAPPFERPLLACGAVLKNTFCLAAGRRAFLGPHIGNLEDLATLESFEAAVDRMERFLDISPEVVAHDLHPELLSTRYARARAGVVTVAVQHHHAHVASAMAEHALEGPVLGVAFDGTGLGPDGAAWGGEFLLADYTGYTRVGTFRPIALAGGDAAIRQIWRLALAALIDAFDGNPPLDRLPLFAGIAERDCTVVRQMIAQGLNTIPAHGVGRHFDAAGAIGLSRPISRFEGQVALEWNLVADPSERSRYDVDVAEHDSLLTVDTRPMVRGLVADLERGSAPSTMAARFHNTLASATAGLVHRLLARHGDRPVVLSGGCFQNARLTESVVRDLGPGVQVHLHQRVPPGDGGLALGQAVVANASARSG